uniref:Phorbol-ester/DAG-type domain-containing protein n=1 Tax=Kalanchoe fedtschenkoi TaxID=63787 RepID=A0A7N0TQP7_KALFE
MKYSEITHFHHPEHTLKLETNKLPFRCNGCSEMGIGSRYKCDICNYDLHLQCALPSPTISHPFYVKCSFTFLSQPPGPNPRFCNACRSDLLGFGYHCHKCGFDLHPCCAKLPMEIADGETSTRICLYRKVWSKCYKCGRRGRSWSYRSRCKRYSLHVACAREMVVEGWMMDGMGFGRSDGGGGGGWLALGVGGGRGEKGLMKRGCEVVLQIVVSAVLGDPAALIAGVIGSLI